MVALCDRAGHYIFCPMVSSSIFFYLPLLFFLTYSQLLQIGCLPYFHTWYGPSVNLECRSECAARSSMEMQDPKIDKNLLSGHHRTTLSGYIFATKACIDNRKKLAKQQYLPHMSSQYGELWPTSCWDLLASYGHRANFNGFRVLAALLTAL